MRIVVHVVFSILFCFCCNHSYADTAKEYYAQWDKAVIENESITALSLYKLPLSQHGPNNSYNIEYLTLNYINCFNNGKLQYNKLNPYNPIELASWINRIPYKENDNVFPKSWDMLGKRKIVINRISSDVLFEMQTSYFINYSNENNYENLLCIGGPIIAYVSKHKMDENGKPMYDEKGGAIIEPMEPDIKDVVYYQLLITGENKFELFILKDNQFLVWEYSQEKFGELKPIIKWEFKYAFKVDKTETYKVCEINDYLYVMMKDAGIYKLDTKKAIENKPEAPTNVLLEYGEIDNKSQVLKWEGFKQEHILENNVKAEKISKLVYDSVVVDKDHETAYFQAGDYFFEITDLDKCVKMPEPREGLETFDDKEVDRMRACLEAIDLLHRSPMKSPDYKTIMGSSNDTTKNPDSTTNSEDSHINEDNGDRENDEDEETESNESSARNIGKSANGTTNDSSNNGNGSEYADSQNSDVNGNNNSNNENSSKSNTSTVNTSDGTDTIIYITIGVGLLILLTLVFLLLSRKKHV